MSVESYQLISSHEDPEYWLNEYPDYISVTTQHSPNMPECVARLLHTIQVRKELESYDLGIRRSEDYPINRYDYDPEIPF